MQNKSKFKQKWWILLIIIIALFLWFIPYLAAYGLIVDNPIKAATVTELINILLNWALQISVPIAAGAIVYAGFLYTTSGGDQKITGKAKDVLTYAVVGLILIILAKSVGSIIQSMF